MPRIEAYNLERSTAQFMYQPRRHRTGLDANASIFASVLAHSFLDFTWHGAALPTPEPPAGSVDNADRRHPLGHVQSDIAGHRATSDVRTTGRQRPDRGTIGGHCSAAITRCPHMTTWAQTGC